VRISPGPMGAFGANQHLRQSLISLNMPTMQAPEAYLGHAAKLFDDAGGFADTSTQDFCMKFLAAFNAWIARITRPLKL
jgi:chromate reductase